MTVENNTLFVTLPEICQNGNLSLNFDSFCNANNEINFSIKKTIGDLTLNVTMPYYDSNCPYTMSLNHITQSSTKDAYTYLCLCIGLLEKGNKEYIDTTIVCFKENVYDKTIKRSAELIICKNMFDTVLQRALPFLLMYYTHETSSKTAFSNALFPYSTLRSGQEKMMKEVYKAICHRERLYVMAPTGIGKTISTIYPAVRAIGQNKIDKIFYLTAKNATGREAFKACSKLFECNIPIRAIRLSSKEQICSCKDLLTSSNRSKSICTPYGCPAMTKYLSNRYDALKKLLLEYHGYDLNIIKKVADEYHVCPYELSLDLSEFCDIVIADYNYLFDRKVSLKRYFEKNNNQKFVFLIDEAHNLSGRICSSYTIEITSNDVNQLIQCFITKDGNDLVSCAQLLKQYMSHYRKQLSNEIEYLDDGTKTAFIKENQCPQKLIELTHNLLQKMQDWLKNNSENSSAGFVYNLSLHFDEFLKVASLFDNHFCTVIKILNSNISFIIYCMDSAGLAEQYLKKSVSAIFFSATLSPLSYYAQMLGGQKNDRFLELPSPFSKDNLCTIILNQVDTRWNHREKTASQIASYIAAMVNYKHGHYMVYFPSYDYLNIVYQCFIKKYPKVSVKVQQQGMNREDRESFLKYFTDDFESLHIGFCVLGGSFSEGIDLPGAQLIGVMIVGTGLPGLSNEKALLQEYYQEKYEQGKNYAYTFPGMNNVLQACGRVIRSSMDRGVIVFCDNRYASEEYQCLLPSHYKPCFFARNPNELANITHEFWKKEQN